MLAVDFSTHPSRGGKFSSLALSVSCNNRQLCEQAAVYLSAMGRGRGRVSPAWRGASPLQGDGGGHLLRGREAPVTAQQNGFVWERVTITSPVWVVLLGMSLSQSPQSHWALSPATLVTATRVVWCGALAEKHPAPDFKEFWNRSIVYFGNNASF